MAERSLQRYRDKRDWPSTPEPFGEQLPAPTGAAGGVFVVHQHAARRTHWDLRIEINGILVSWAVPRGPSLDPKEKRLAVRTEDHPQEYADFEGVIPAGNYGAGAMIVWDRGGYRTVTGEQAGDGLAHGKLDVEFAGHKMRGRWVLVRTKGDGGKNWLLIKKGSERAPTPEWVAAQAASVLSGLTVEELQKGSRRTGELTRRAQAAGARRHMVKAVDVRPMLAETAERAFSKPGWVFELKYDGVRAFAVRDRAGRVRLQHRTGREATALFPEIAKAVARLPADEFIIDGEIVSLTERGVSSFERLQRRLGLSNAAAIARADREVPVVMYCFDLLAVGGYDLRHLPLTTRKQLLELLVPRVGMLRFAEHFEHDGQGLFAAASELGLEGIVAKRAASPYRSGRRSGDWLKIKALKTADVVITGYVHGRGARKDLGSLMLAWRKDGQLVYAGNVGTGLDTHTIRALLPRLQAASRATPAFRGTPPGPARANVFVEPQLVAEVRYTEVTSAGFLRQPVFLRLRDDKTVAECTAPSTQRVVESPPPVPQPRAPNLRLTNLDKLFWPQAGYTKGDLLRYYEQVWPWMAPYLRDRPVVLTRYPEGIEGKSFFQKNAPDFTPTWVERCRIEDTDYFICNELPALLYIINSGCIPVHVWSAHRGSLDRPDWAILDLDPKGAPFRQAVTVARYIHALLDDLRAPHFVKTSGQDGLHVFLPLGATLSHTEARTFAEVLARVVAAEAPDIATVARPLGERGGKVYIDFLQNGFGKTIAAPFSVRPRPGAPVSTPITWREVGARLDPARFTIRTVPQRLRRRADPLKPVLDTTIDVPSLLTALRERLR